MPESQSFEYSYGFRVLGIDVCEVAFSGVEFHEQINGLFAVSVSLELTEYKNADLAVLRKVDATYHIFLDNRNIPHIVWLGFNECYVSFPGRDFPVADVHLRRSFQKQLP